jgi:DNA processing protein
MHDTGSFTDVSVSMSPAQLAAWMRLERTPGVGPRTAPALLSAFGSPDAIFAADHALLAAHLSPVQVRAILQPASADTLRLVDATLRWRDQPGHTVLALGQPGYPDLLAAIPDPPLLLYIKGCPDLLAGPALAIVGSRNASTQGKANARPCRGPAWRSCPAWRWASTRPRTKARSRALAARSP